MQKVTIKDIARELDLSYSTVSLCLNSSPRVNAETMARVKETATRMGYAPNARARAFVKRQTQVIGIVVPDITNPFFSAITRGAESVATERDFRVLILDTDRRADLEERQIKLITEGHVDGLLVTSVHNRSEMLDTILDRQLPLVFVNNPYPHPNASLVGSDGFETGQIAAQHLLGLGHRRIAVCGVASETQFQTDMMSGFIRCLEEQSVPWKNERRIDGEFSVASGCESGHRLLERFPDVSAVFAFDDLIALGVLRAIEESGLRVPQDISVMGCDDVFLASLPRIGLTTIRQQTREMGQVAMDLLLDHIARRLEGGTVTRQRLSLGSELVVRQSTSPPSASRATQ